MNEPEAVKALIEMLKDSVDTVSGVAAFSLGNLNDEQAVEPLMDYARRKLDNRESAVVALGKLKDDRAIELLIDIAINDRNKDTRQAAFQALENYPPEVMEQLREKVQSLAVKPDPTGHVLYDLMHDTQRVFDEENPITFASRDAILFYNGGKSIGWKNTWILQIPTGPYRYDYRRMKINPDQSPDLTVFDILEKAPEWRLTIDSIDRLYALMTSGINFDLDNPILIEKYANIYKDQQGSWSLRIHISREMDKAFDVPPITPNIGEKVKEMIAAVGISLMGQR